MDRVVWDLSNPHCHSLSFIFCRSFIIIIIIGKLDRDRSSSSYFLLSFLVPCVNLNILFLQHQCPVGILVDDLSGSGR